MGWVLFNLFFVIWDAFNAVFSFSTGHPGFAVCFGVLLFVQTNLLLASIDDI